MPIAPANQIANETEIAAPATSSPRARTAPASTKQRLQRRTARDYSQKLRLAYQVAFLGLNVWVGSQFYLWVRHFETAGRTAAVPRPAGVEGYLPIAGLMNLKYWLLTAHVPAIHPAAMFLVITFVLMALLLRKAFCGWLCPVGTFSEFLWKLGRRFFRRNLQLPRWADLPLRSFKYLLLAFFLWAVGSMSDGEIAAFLRSPYGLIADVKMLNFFRFLGMTGAITLSVLVAASVLVQNFWCRYLCPYGALLGLVSLASPLRIRRDPQACIDCAKCAKACPATLPVDKLLTVKSAECTACLECVAMCPAASALSMSTAGPRGADGARWHRLHPWAIAAGIAVLFFGIGGYARLTRHWNTTLPRDVYMQLVPHANEATHPMPGQVR
jgi:polyferredoxin